MTWYGDMKSHRARLRAVLLKSSSTFCSGSHLAVSLRRVNISVTGLFDSREHGQGTVLEVDLCFYMMLFITYEAEMEM